MRLTLEVPGIKPLLLTLPLLLAVVGVEAAPRPNIVFLVWRSLVPLIQNPAVSPWRTRFLVEYQGQANHLGETSVPEFYAVRTLGDPGVPNALFAQWEDANASEEFYDLTTDPEQMDSRHADPRPRRPGT